MPHACPWPLIKANSKLPLDHFGLIHSHPPTFTTPCARSRSQSKLSHTLTHPLSTTDTKLYALTTHSPAHLHHAVRLQLVTDGGQERPLKALLAHTCTRQATLLRLAHANKVVDVRSSSVAEGALQAARPTCVYICVNVCEHMCVHMCVCVCFVCCVRGKDLGHCRRILFCSTYTNMHT